MIGSSMLMASFGFMIHSITPVLATDAKKNNFQTIPINTDGTITVKITNEQLKLLTPPEIQPVNIEQIRGTKAAFIEGSIGGDNVHSLGTCSHTEIK
jgi:hypothetical protein